MQKRLGIATLVVILASRCAPAPMGRVTRQPQWSENLGVYSYSAEHPYSDTAIAASADNVAVALDISRDTNATLNLAAAPLSSNWKLSLLVFDATNGKFRTACGPWFGGILFDLWSTSDGNFLLYQESDHVAREKTSGRILLLSPSCQVLKKMELPALGGEGGTQSLISPTQRTFLITEHSGRRIQCEVLSANTLLERFKIAIASDDPRIVAVSDDGLLGIKSTPPGSSTSVVAGFFYFEFHAQKWTEVPGPAASVAPDSVRFVSSDALLEASTTGNTGAWAASGVRLVVRRMDGAAAFSTVIFRKATNISLGSPLAVSATGNYFGVVLSSYSVASFWRFLDMSPGHDQGYVWSARSAKPIARISMRSGSQHQELAFAPDDLWFALRSGKTLIVRPLPGQRPPKH